MRYKWNQKVETPHRSELEIHSSKAPQYAPARRQHPDRDGLRRVSVRSPSSACPGFVTGLVVVRRNQYWMPWQTHRHKREQTNKQTHNGATTKIEAPTHPAIAMKTLFPDKAKQWLALCARPSLNNTIIILIMSEEAGRELPRPSCRVFDVSDTAV